MTQPPVRWVASDDVLAEVVDHLVGAPAYAVDTEFHRERTYYPRLALVLVMESAIPMSKIDLSGEKS